MTIMISASIESQILMNKRNLFFAISTIICLLHTNNLKAEKSEIPLCYLGHEVFDEDFVSYEDYILSKLTLN